MSATIRSFALRGFAFGLVLALWQAVSLLTGNPQVVPGLPYLLRDSYPSFALFGNSTSISYGAATRVLAWSAMWTAERALLGLGIGTAVGTALGLSIFALRAGRRSAQSMLYAATSIPLFGLMPLFVYWFAGKELGIVLYVIIAVTLITATATYEAALNVPRHFQWHAALAGAGRMEILRTVIYPAILPELGLTLRWTLGLVWAFTLGAEYLSSDSSGCGYLVYESYLYADVGKLLVMAGVYALLGSASMFLFNWAMRGPTLAHFTSRWDTLRGNN